MKICTTFLGIHVLPFSMVGTMVGAMKGNSPGVAVGIELSPSDGQDLEIPDGLETAP